MSDRLSTSATSQMSAFHPNATLAERRFRPNRLRFATKRRTKRCVIMSDEAKRFRDHAKECRVLAKGARNMADTEMLEEIAAEMDEEARGIDAEAAKPPSA